MELNTLLKLSSENQELKLENAYFHGEKIESLLKSLKKHVVLIQVQTSFLNQGNCPDLVIEYSGPSTGRFIFHGQLFSRPELKANEKEEKIIKKEAEKRQKTEEKEQAKKWRENQKVLSSILKKNKALKCFNLEKGYCYLYTDFQTIFIAKTFRGLEAVELSTESMNGEKYFFTESSAVIQSPFWMKDFKEIRIKL